MSHSTTSGRGSLDAPPPDPLDEVAAGREVAPEHRARGEPAAVRVELVAARPAPLEASARAGRPGAPPRAARPASSARSRGGAGPRPAVGVGRDRRCRRSAPRRRSSSPSAGIGVPRSSAPRLAPLVAGLGRLAPGASSSRAASSGVRRRSARISLGDARPRGARQKRSNDRVVDLEVVAAADEHGGAGRLDLLAVADVDERQRPREVDRGAEVDGRPAARSARPNPTASPSSWRPSTSGARTATGRWRDRSRSTVRSVSRQPPARPRRGIARGRRRGRAGRPPRT